MARRKPTTPKHLTHDIFTIYGQIEAVAAGILIDEGNAKRIDAADVPPSHAFNDRGTPARFAVSMPKTLVPRFDRLVDELRA